jgi:hypothetical protein
VAELRIAAPPADVKHIGFHATGLRIHSVTVEGTRVRPLRVHACAR